MQGTSPLSCNSAGSVGALEGGAGDDLSEPDHAVELQEIDPDIRGSVVDAVVELSRAIDRWRARAIGGTVSGDRSGGENDDREADA